ncbi:MAG: YabP/YqfC family sporulation protein [Oscillospiraceae bacterium]
MSGKKIKINTSSKKNPIRLFSKALEIPPCMTGAGVKIETVSNKEASVEGCRGITEYYDNFIKINIGCGTVCFSGENLHIYSYNDQVALIKGIIKNIEYCI